MVRFGRKKNPSKEQLLMDHLRQLQEALNKQENSDAAQQKYLMEEIQRMRSTMSDLQRKASFQNKTINHLQETTLQQNQKIQKSQRVLEMQLKKNTDGFVATEFEEMQEESLDEIYKGSIDVQAANGHKWRASGYSSVVPHPDFNYFPGLQFGPRLSADGLNYDYSEGKVISTIVPCYNESRLELDRTIRSLHRQRLPPGWRIEVVVVMDGADHMSESMKQRVKELFGINLNSKDTDLNPLLALPQAETIIVEPRDAEAARRRTPAIEGTIGGYTLVVKRQNHRKANSQMWWLGPHGSFLKCKYALATDCGTVFARTATIHLIRRLDAEESLHAVTGFQRIMSSQMQGDGSWELFHNPFDFLLRMVQRFEFEMDHVSFKSIYDSIGCMHVIPGPCGLFRYSAMGSLREGLMYEYFRLFQHSSQGLIVGNVELVEDRIPGTLLSFPLKGDKVKAQMPPEGWPRTGFVHEALFYVEAEKPISQLIKQRRRWLNGTLATYIWMLNEGIITRSNQDPINKFLSWFLVVLNLIQGFVIRLFGPSLLVVWMFRFGLYIPDLWNDPSSIFDPQLSLTSLEIEEGRLPYGVIAGGSYLFLYIVYILGHIPHAKPVSKTIQITRYTEPTAYSSDKGSAYRSWLFTPVLSVNFLLILLFILNVIGVLVTQGWTGTPLVVKILICICFVPFGMGVIEGLMYRDFRCLAGMIYSAPFAMTLMLWFSIWLPAYATTRLSDLTWGNRERISSLDESEKALARAHNGRKVGWMLILSTIFISLGVILLMQVNGQVFPAYVLGYTMILSSTYIFSLMDMMLRIMTCSSCDTEDPLIEEYQDEPELNACGCANGADDEGYVVMETEQDDNNSVDPKSSSSASNKSTAKVDDSNDHQQQQQRSTSSNKTGSPIQKVGSNLNRVASKMSEVVGAKAQPVRDITITALSDSATVSSASSSSSKPEHDNDGGEPYDSYSAMEDPIQVQYKMFNEAADVGAQPLVSSHKQQQQDIIPGKKTPSFFTRPKRSARSSLF